MVSSTDGAYHDPGTRGRYQGIVDEHWVEIELPNGLPEGGPLWLVARGWIHPTDSSVNYAIAQGKHVAPHGLILEVPNEQGGWTIARDQLGFPAGKNKTVLLRLDDLNFGANMPSRLRLRTNLEIYWDSILVARGWEDPQASVKVLKADEVDLRFRGIVAMTQANASSPEIPHYDPIISIGQNWRDLIGYHTRYGDVSELLRSVDDRYAILCAGDEVVLRFMAPEATPPGWKRDFVWIADGWVKDGDFNTRFGKSVLPLPAHSMQSYNEQPQDLENDPVYQRFPNDWQIYHTRYVTPHVYEQGLRSSPLL